ncbi:hypothetical protein LSH36_17g04043 [Paralvinella palmiformis]|uniref:Uncharacterized protein n=1 Tax=Paralvinella palmiformis TaxID=53620 RepID=A0AAD9KBW3_9ANNE|nr:hypothetical protein LSH36_17g04043 [Paralvinella palmiformis]
MSKSPSTDSISRKVPGFISKRGVPSTAARGPAAKFVTEFTGAETKWGRTSYKRHKPPEGPTSSCDLKPQADVDVPPIVDVPATGDDTRWRLQPTPVKWFVLVKDSISDITIIQYTPQ